jgi:dipeptidyl aminopeptidase/acylaminoacyl peptidase
MSTSSLTIEHLLAVRHPADASISPDGRDLATVVADECSPEPGRSPAARLWIGPLGGPMRQITTQHCADGVPRWSPAGDEVAFCSDRDHAGRMSLYVAHGASGAVSPLGDIRGSVEEIAWSADGTSLMVLAADVGLDTAGSLNAVSITDASRAGPDPIVLSGPPGLRRLYHVDRASGSTRELDLAGLTVWDFSWNGTHALAAFVSADPSESGWYGAAVVVYQLSASVREVARYQPRWQLGIPRLAQDGSRLAFVEGVCSDRGILAGQLMIADVAGSQLHVRQAGVDNVKYLDWLDGESILYTAASGLGSVIGTAAGSGETEPPAPLWRADLTLGYRYHARTSADAAGRRVVAVAEGASYPPEVGCLTIGDDGSASWAWVTDFNSEVAGLADGDWPAWQSVTWTSDGQEIEGILVLPPGRPAKGLPLVLMIHGGPTASWTYQWSNYGLPALWATAGYAVLMPNPRGSAGYGQAFAAANVHDIGGGELRDVLAGVDALVDSGIADERRIGVTGGSHGGYMTNWAITQTARFAASIPVAGSANRLSKYNTGNIGALEELFYDPDPYDLTGKVLSRSPIVHVRGVRTPTLIVHGEKDRCVPVGQAYEMYAGLARLGNVPVELVIYPREGHSISERAHRIDFWERSKAWFDRYVAGV